MSTFKAVATVEFTQQQIIDLFVTACEGGSNYWCSDLTPTTSHKDAYEAMLYGFDLNDRESGKKHYVSPEAIAKAVELLPIKAPIQFGEIMREEYDAVAGDVFLQLCVFGEVIYG